MKKFTPSILIWNVELCDKEDDMVLQNLYFFSYKRAQKFVEKHEAELADYNVSIGGESLWLW